jgi:hypothetical protein
MHKQAEDRLAKDVSAAARADVSTAGALKEKGAKIEAELQVAAIPFFLYHALKLLRQYRCNTKHDVTAIVVFNAAASAHCLQDAKAQLKHKSEELQLLGEEVRRSASCHHSTLLCPVPTNLPTNANTDHSNANEFAVLTS